MTVPPTVQPKSSWVKCPFCPLGFPAWAQRAQWEHVDTSHRDDGPADTPWVPMTDPGHFTGCGCPDPYLPCLLGRTTYRSGPSTQTCTCTRCGMMLGRNPRPHPCRRRRIKRWLRNLRQDPRKPSDA